MITDGLLLFVILSGLLSSLPEEKILEWNAGRGYEPFRYSTTEGLTICNVTDSLLSDIYELGTPVNSVSLTFKASNKHPAKPWGVCLTTSEGDNLWIYYVCKEPDDPVSSQTSLDISVFLNDKECIAKASVTSGAELFTGSNIWHLEYGGKRLSLNGGDHSEKPIFSVSAPDATLTSFGFVASPGSELLVKDISLQFPELSEPEGEGESHWENLEYLGKYLNESDDPMEGYWIVFDRTLDEDLLRLGGDYRMAMVKVNEGYDLLYISGARINGSDWKPGQVKVRLRKDFFPDLFNVTWFDSMHLPLKKDIKGQKEVDDTFVITFPYQQSTVRLRKIISGQSN